MRLSSGIFYKNKNSREWSREFLNILLANVGGLVGDLLLRIVNIISRRIDGEDGVVLTSRASCQCHSGKDSSYQKFDSIHDVLLF